MSRAVLYVLLETLFRYFMSGTRKRRYILFAFSSACLPYHFPSKFLLPASPSRRRLIPPNYLLYERASKITMTTQSLFWHRDFPLFLSFFEMVLLIIINLLFQPSKSHLDLIAAPGHLTYLVSSKV